MKTPTGKQNNFIKVIDQETAKKLISLGFSYTREGEFFAFAATPELMSVLQQHYSGARYFAENKLRF